MTAAVALDAGQQQALDSIRAWLRHGDGTWQVHGRAGTGKTTLIRHLSDVLRVPVLAPTNKAAAVLRNKGISQARTLHSWMYITTTTGTEPQIRAARMRLDACRPGSPEFRLAQAEVCRLESLEFRLKDSEPEDDTVILDECSMVGQAAGRDLTSVVSAIVAFGDPWQLPPVEESPYFAGGADSTLLTIHRQGRGSGILDLALNARERWPLQSQGPQAVAVRGNDFGPEQYLSRLAAADQVLVGTNRTRRLLNHQLRYVIGKGPLPVAGDTMTCVRCPMRRARKAGLVNGFGYVVRGVTHAEDGTLELELEDTLDGGLVRYSMDPVEFLRASLPLDVAGAVEDKYLGWDAPPIDFDSALTVHKAQGSEWRSVVVQNQGLVFDEPTHDMPKRWLYTAITRAKEQVLVLTGSPALPPLPASYLP